MGLILRFLLIFAIVMVAHLLVISIEVAHYWTASVLVLIGSFITTIYGKMFSRPQPGN